jgi:predicted Zn finger-like uncharacterized protein
MLIVCPNCATSYRVETISLGEEGRSVRCVRCRNVWFASDPSLPISEWPQFEWRQALPQAEAPVAVLAAPTLPVQQDRALPPAGAWRGERRDASGVRGHRRPTHGNRRSLSFVPVAVVALIALHGALIGRRTEIVKVAPQTAPLYAAIGLPVNLRGLTFANVTTVTQVNDGVPVLVVEGAIASASAHAVEVPRLRLSIRNSSGQEVYAWTALPERNVLAPRETLPFRSQLASPPPDARDVAVRFVNRNDLATGIRHAAAEIASKH